MLFNSYLFIFIFLPIALIGFYYIGSSHQRAAFAWLLAASLLFYGWWNPIYLLLIGASIIINFYIGNHLNQYKSKTLLTAGVALNLGAIAYFKYANFFIDSANALMATNIHLEKIILPLAISFFTFQQIAYLVDSYQQVTKESSLLNYSLFVCFFPQLIAGPIVHHREMMPQFGQTALGQFNHKHIAIGFSIFVVGLFKKVVIADHIARYSTPMFEGAHQGEEISFFAAWLGSLSYTFQLYFDFSGYSDMAIGIAYMFGIKLVLNFYSPYKSVNIVDFWRRWHITLSRFLRDYIYIPLGGNRKGNYRRYLNLFITMLLGGLWHGAGWTFVLWGALHGLLLIINHGWHKIRRKLGIMRNKSTFLGRNFARSITFVTVTVAWVLFRAEDLPSAIVIYESMLGQQGVFLPTAYLGYFSTVGLNEQDLLAIGLEFKQRVHYFYGLEQLGSLLLLFAIVWIAPNTYQLFRKFSPYVDQADFDTESTHGLAKLYWTPKIVIACVISLMFISALIGMDATSEFLYFQF